MTNKRSVAAVIVTHDRPELLKNCLHALSAQTHAPDCIFVIDNASREPVGPLVALVANALTIRLERNLGAAAEYAAGIRAARAGGFTHVWMMDDDGLPADPSCLASLLATEAECDSALTCPLVLDVADRARLALPIRQAGRTRFTVAALKSCHLPRPAAPRRAAAASSRPQPRHRLSLARGTPGLHQRGKLAVLSWDGALGGT